MIVKVVSAPERKRLSTMSANLIRQPKEDCHMFSSPLYKNKPLNHDRHYLATTICTEGLELEIYRRLADDTSSEIFTGRR